MIKSLKLYFNNTPVTPQSDDYGFRYFNSHLLNESHKSKNYALILGHICMLHSQAAIPPEIHHYSQVDITLMMQTSFRVLEPTQRTPGELTWIALKEK